MFTQREIISDFQRMEREHWNYKWGCHETGRVDCSGAFVWSYDRHGENIYNGANRIARVYVQKVIPIAEARSKGLIVPGVAAFKIYTPDSQYYGLKDTYKPGGKYYNGDLNDYHHIGLVDDNINYVLNAQGAKTGFVRSSIKEHWSHIGYLNAIIYEGVKQVEEIKMIVTNLSPGTSIVNMRREPSPNAVVIDKLKAGTIVTKVGECGVWTKVEAQNKIGWIMSQYLSANINGDVISDETNVVVSRKRLEAIYDELGDILSLRG